MAELKTKVNKASVGKFLGAIKDARKRDDCFAISRIFEKASKSKRRAK
jgi:hypothetical protein